MKTSKIISVRTILFTLALSPVVVSAGDNSFPPAHLHPSASFDEPTQNVESRNEVAWYLNVSEDSRVALKNNEIHESSPDNVSAGSIVIYSNHLNSPQQEIVKRVVEQEGGIRARLLTQE